MKTTYLNFKKIVDVDISSKIFYKGQIITFFIDNN